MSPPTEQIHETAEARPGEKSNAPQSSANVGLLYDSFGMNPRTLRFFLLEKGLDVPRRETDILGAENRGPAFLKLNPAGQLPALELSDGTVISETPAICEYVEELFPSPSLIGRTVEERAVTRMWWRRVELNICVPMVQGFYYSEALGLFKDRFRCLPFTVADICLYCYIDQLCEIGQPIAAGCSNLQSWFDRVGSRPAAERSIWKDRPMGMRG
jgi:glutathione S-transferase